MIKKYLEPEEVWPYYLESESGEFIIAENEEYGLEVVLYKSGQSPIITVYMDDDEVAFKEFDNAGTCESVVREMYELLEKENAIQILTDSLDDDFQASIKDRESELDTAIEDFVIEVTQDYPCDGDYEEMIQDLKEHFLAYMYKKHGLIPYRPMILVDDKGKESYEDYPYKLLFS